MTAALNPETVRPEPTGDGVAGPPRGFFKSRYGSTSLRVGVATTWLSLIVLLPLAAIVWQSAGGGWQGVLAGGDVQRGHRVVPGHTDDLVRGRGDQSRSSGC